MQIERPRRLAPVASSHADDAARDVGHGGQKTPFGRGEAMDAGQRLRDRPALGIGGGFDRDEQHRALARVRTLLATSSRIIQTAAGTLAHSTPSHPT